MNRLIVVGLVIVVLLGAAIALMFALPISEKRETNLPIENLAPGVPSQTSDNKEVQDLSDIQADKLVDDLLDNESLIRELNPRLKLLTKLLRQLEIPATHEVFADEVNVREIQQLIVDESQASPGKGNVVQFQTGELEPASNTSIWQSLTQYVSFFDQAKFYNVRINNRIADEQKIFSKTGFSALARTKDGNWMAIKSTGEIEWKKIEKKWRITSINFSKFDSFEIKNKFFTDVTGSVLEPAEYQELIASPHREKFLRVVLSGAMALPNELEKKYFRHIPLGSQHSSAAIVDVNGDGWDDVFLAEAWRPSRLFLNSNGRLKDVTEDLGIDVKKYATSALFFDFDNDGDQDLFVGRSLSSSLFFENIDGQFVERTRQYFSNPLPALVSSLSSVDFDGDGLLDLYISTYGFPEQKVDLNNWAGQFLNKQDAKQVKEKYDSPDHDRYVNATGPPNLLYRNTGKGFELAGCAEDIKLFMNTFQAVWSDYDMDGDPDLYVANDFGRDHLFRNEQGQGFTDVTFEVGGSSMCGFGMGADWGDIDLDGRQDLYVSNMYSKAGMRILGHFKGIKEEVENSANGNRLYTNKGGQLELVSNVEADVTVDKAGWSWGGQFVDIDNDGLLDIYVVSGYFTAPKIFASDRDL